MSIRIAEGGDIVLEGHCGIDDTEPLLASLLHSPEAKLDWRACSGAHTAIVQLMLVSGREVIGPPGNPFLKTQIQPLFVG